jgi:hypothetical protein
MLAAAGGAASVVGASGLTLESNGPALLASSTQDMLSLFGGSNQLVLSSGSNLLATAAGFVSIGAAGAGGISLSSAGAISEVATSVVVQASSSVLLADSSSPGSGTGNLAAAFGDSVSLYGGSNMLAVAGSQGAASIRGGSLLDVSSGGSVAATAGATLTATASSTLLAAGADVEIAASTGNLIASGAVAVSLTGGNSLMLQGGGPMSSLPAPGMLGLTGGALLSLYSGADVNLVADVNANLAPTVLLSLSGGSSVLTQGGEGAFTYSTGLVSVFAGKSGQGLTPTSVIAGTTTAGGGDPCGYGSFGSCPGLHMHSESTALLETPNHLSLYGGNSVMLAGLSALAADFGDQIRFSGTNGFYATSSAGPVSLFAPSEVDLTGDSSLYLRSVSTANEIANPLSTGGGKIIIESGDLVSLFGSNSLALFTGTDAINAYDGLGQTQLGFILTGSTGMTSLFSKYDRIALSAPNGAITSEAGDFVSLYGRTGFWSGSASSAAIYSQGGAQLRGDSGVVVSAGGEATVSATVVTLASTTALRAAATDVLSLYGQNSIALRTGGPMLLGSSSIMGLASSDLLSVFGGNSIAIQAGFLPDPLTGASSAGASRSPRPTRSMCRRT